MTDEVQDEVRLLRGLELFAGLDRVSLSKLAAHLEVVALEDGAVLFHSGDVGDALYLVRDGALGVYGMAAEGTEVRLATFRRGDAVGEMALLTGETRSATVRADGPTAVLRLERARFLALVRSDPEVALAIAATLSHRLHAANVARLGRPAEEDRASPEDRRRERTDTVWAAPVARRGRRLGRIAGAALAVLLLAVGWAMPAPAGLDSAAWRVLVALIAILPLLILDVVPDGIAAMALVVAWVLGSAVPARTALAGFANPVWLLTVCVLLIGAGVATTGLPYRVALWAVARARGFASQAIALAASGIVVGAVLSNAPSRVGLIAPAVAEIAEASGYGERSRPAAGLGMASLVGYGLVVALFLTSSTSALLVQALLPTGVDWGTWLLRSAVTHVMLVGGLVAFLLLRYRPAAGERGPRADRLALQQALLGPASGRERATLAVLGLVVAGFATQPLHGIEPPWVAASAVLALGVLGLLSADTLRAANWSYLLLFGVLASVGEVFRITGLDRWIGETSATAASAATASPVLFIVVAALLSHAVSLVVRFPAAAPLMTIALLPLATAAHVDPWIVGFVALTSTTGMLLPYQNNSYLALHQGTGGRLFTHAQARPLALAYLGLSLFALIASVPVWHAMGLL